MAKRYTDTEKWKKESFCELSLKMKIAWVFICDNCDHAGIWDANFRLMSFQIGEPITKEEINAAFGDKLRWITEKKVYVQTFIEFQYGTLNPLNRVHQSVILRHESLGLLTPLISPLNGAKEKDKEKDLVKESSSSAPAHTQRQAELFQGDPEAKTKKKKFVQPTEKEVEEYFLSRGMSAANATHWAAEFIRYYNSIGWVVGKDKPMKSWPDAAAGWITRNKIPLPYKDNPLKKTEAPGDINKAAPPPAYRPTAVADK